MAIFSLNHSFIGRSTHSKGAASLYARYIMREEACTQFITTNLTPYDAALMRWLDAQETGDRRNARFIDKIVVALPRELTHEQNAELLNEFGTAMSEGNRVYWGAAMHDGPKDTNNPHAHLIFRDRDVETGRRVMMTTEKGSTQHFRDVWEDLTSRALEREGYSERIDKRSLEEQCIDREPQIHVGAGAQKMREKDHPFESEEKKTTRLVDGVRTEFTINYPEIDQGKTRFEENEERKARNAEQERLMLDKNAAVERLMQVYEHALKYGAKTGNPNDEAFADIVGHHIAFREREARAEARREGEKPERIISGGREPESKRHRDPVSGLALGGLSVVGKIAESLETLFEFGSPAEKEIDAMADKDTKQQRQETHDRLQAQRNREAELSNARERELQAYLNERQKGRGVERGR